MCVDEFMLDLGEFEEEVVEEQASQERVRSGWRREKGRYICLVPNCRERKLDFAQKLPCSDTGRRSMLVPLNCLCVPSNLHPKFQEGL